MSSWIRTLALFIIMVTKIARNKRPNNDYIIICVPDRRHCMAAEFSGVLHITVHKIDEFSDMAGFMDRTDPYVM